MKVVTLALKEKGLKINDLPEELQDRIVNLKELVDKYNQTLEEYDKIEEEDKETEKKLDDMEDFIAENDKDIAAEIKNYNPAPDPAPAPDPEPTPAPAPEKKKDGGLGWLVFGGLVLVATVGAVNLLKKK